MDPPIACAQLIQLWRAGLVGLGIAPEGCRRQRHIPQGRQALWGGAGDQRAYSPRNGRL